MRQSQSSPILERVTASGRTVGFVFRPQWEKDKRHPDTCWEEKQQASRAAGKVSV